MGSKAHLDAAFHHTAQRANERYGIMLTRQEYDRIGQVIRQGRARCVHRTSNNKTLWLVSSCDQDVVAVYNKNLHAVVSFLPLSAADPDTLPAVRTLADVLEANDAAEALAGVPPL